jgi:MFS family permease
VLSLPGARGFFGTAASARLGVAMSSGAVLWAVRGATGSFGSAGVCTALFAVAEASAGPQIARLVDERGQRRILPWSVGVFTLAVAALVVGARLHLALPVLAVSATVAGASIPQVGAYAAARWRHVVHNPDQVSSALSLEAAVNDLAFLCGPMLVSSLSAIWYPAAGLTLAGGLIAVGMALLLAQHRSEPPAQGRSVHRLVDRRLLTPAVFALFALNMSMGFFFGAIPVTIIAFAFAHHAAAATGLITVPSSLTSLAAGLAYGAHARRFDPVATILAMSCVLALGTAALALVPNIALMVVCYSFVGGAVAPVLVPAGILLQRLTDPGVYTQAMTWMNSASAAGIAVAAPIAGFAVQAGDWRYGCLVTAGLAATLPVTVAIARRSLVVPRPVLAAA